MHGIIFLLAALAAGAAASTPGGPYGLGQTPYMGWRSWNAYHNNVNQTLLEEVMAAMVQKQIDGRSLSDLGFTSVGLDDAWQGFDSGKPGIDACQRGYNGTFHDEHGNPLWAKATFPDPAGMVAKAHSLGLKAGWYMNNCQCRENHQTNATWVAAVYRQSVAMLADQKWDAVKLDGCSQFHNTSLWANLMEESGHPIAIENCNNEHPPAAGPNPDWADHDGQCPYNWYRTSTDIQPSWPSIMNNFAATGHYTQPTQDLTHPRSKPGCWAYADMLEVGNMATFEEDRAHFGAWCIVSSPLVLGYDVLNTSITENIWPIISNRKAVQVNQQWAGHPGHLIKAWDVGGSFLVAGNCSNPTPAVQGWAYAAGHLMHGGLCVDSSLDQSELEVATCDARSPNQNFTAGPGGTFAQGPIHGSPGGCIDICAQHPCGPVQLAHCHAGSNQEFTIDDGGMLMAKSGQCVAVSTADPAAHSGGGGRVSNAASSDFSLWAKPLPGGVTAVFLMSNQNATTQRPSAVTITFSELGLMSGAPMTVEDIWSGKTHATAAKSEFVTDTVGGHDSRFYLLKPTAGN